MPGNARAGVLARIERVIDGAADIFGLIVEAGVDFVQAARLGAALGEVLPIVEPLTRRPAVAAAGELAETVERHGRGIEPELEAVDFSGIARLGVGRHK